MAAEGCFAVQVLTRGVSEQTMRIRSMKLENKQLRQQLADHTALWLDLQHDLVVLNGIPEGKGRRQQVPPPPTPHPQLNPQAAVYS